MDTKFIIQKSATHNIDTSKLPNLNDDELELCEKYIDLTNNIIETDQLFDAFYFNYLMLQNSFKLNLDGSITRTDHYFDFYSEYIAINSLVTNVISSAKTFTEFLRQIATEHCINKDDFDKYVSNIYDSSTNYFILNNLRNFVQHRSLSLSFENGIYSFDLVQILFTKHSNLNKNFTMKLEDFIEQHTEYGGEYPRIILAYALVDYTVKIIEIYKKYLFTIKKDVSHCYRSVIKLAHDTPELINHSEEKSNDLFMFKKSNETHCFLINDNPNKNINSYEEKINRIYKIEKKVLDDLNTEIKNSYIN